MAQSIFERNGGFAAVSRVVSAFYEQVLDSPTLGPYFEEVDMRRQIDHQTKFIASIMGGPASYSNAQLARTHKVLSISDADFYEVTDLLKEALEDADFSESDISEVYSELVKRKNHIVSDG